jgi:serine/threonine-protein kinase
MAIVYQARDRETDADVAIKVLRRELAQSVSAQRFLREITYLRTLRHPGILPILDSAEQSDSMFFVMPYFAGETLRQRLRRDGPFAEEEVTRIVTDLASALDYAHQRNIVHRDLKPENVLLTASDAVLCDFGVARAIILSSNDARLSSSGIAVGTPCYMSPEQHHMDATIDGRCDIYALGCVAYEMLTGEPPFTSASVLALIAAHTSQPPRSIRSVRPEVSPAAEAAILAALAKRAAERPPTGAAFVARFRGEQAPS